jgi:hypothetical protein
MAVSWIWSLSPVPGPPELLIWPGKQGTVEQDTQEYIPAKWFENQNVP